MNACKPHNPFGPVQSLELSEKETPNHWMGPAGHSKLGVGYEYGSDAESKYKYSFLMIM